jgi:HAD superfamily hydrolase (TIGR01484 family)
MKPLRSLDAAVARRLEGIVFDLDGTLLTEGALTLEAYDALFAMRRAGLALAVCTGRPAAWGELLARQWPVDVAITENGAIAYRARKGAPEKLDRLGPEERRDRRGALAVIVEQLRERFDDVPLADDNYWRLSDFTFDIGESHEVSAARAAELRSAAEGLGARVYESSIHLHVTLDGDDKASGTLHALASTRKEDPSAALGRWAFVGDSGNDEACFAAFKVSFAVRNVEPYLGRLSVVPRYVSDGAAGAGFAEIGRRLCELRTGAA